MFSNLKPWMSVFFALKYCPNPKSTKIYVLRQTNSRKGFPVHRHPNTKS